MTAEIAILNRHAVVLAADSVVTVGTQRTWKTANKLFSLSPVNDIGIMIYGTGEFNGYSWEIIAKTFREKIGDRVFDTVADCGEELLSYLRSSKFNTTNKININISYLIYDNLERIKHVVGEYQSEEDYNRALKDVLRKEYGIVEKNYERLGVPADQLQFEDDQSDLIPQLIEDMFKFKPTSTILKLFYDLLYLAIDSKMESSYVTGIVVTGYGNKQLFPELIDYRLDGIHRGFERTWIGREVNLNEDDGCTAIMVPFAQSDMIDQFMRGFTDNHFKFIQQTLMNLLNVNSSRLIDKYVEDESKRSDEMEVLKQENMNILSSFTKEFVNYVQKEMVEPVVEVISTLPKEEMAAMAEALVEITSLRRKVDSTLETVGGPTDVAIISKGDGYVWIKRKYYFDIALNPEFLKRKQYKHGSKHAK